jgi:hypothetical protein
LSCSRNASSSMSCSGSPNKGEFCV